MRTNEISLTAVEAGKRRIIQLATLPFLKKRLYELGKHERNQSLVDGSFRAIRNLSLKSS